MLPVLSGAPVRVVVRDAPGPFWAQTSIPHRTIYLDPEVLRKQGEFERILVHEMFHFAWVRLSNQTRRAWELLLEKEWRSKTRGELGWSAELRKEQLTTSDVRRRSLAWRRYACESFCDTAARLYSGLARHPEFTLPSSAVRQRTLWMQQIFATNGVRL